MATGVVNAVGLGQVGAGLQVTFATKPAAGTLPSEVKTKVKHPFPAEDVIDAGNVVPVYVASKLAVPIPL